jgi:hypothetical protein
MKHEHESYDYCSVCNTEAALCQYCGSDVRMVGGTGSSKYHKSTCNDCNIRWLGLD